MNRRARISPIPSILTLLAMAVLASSSAAALAITLTSAGPVGGGPAHPQGSGHRPVPTFAVSDAPLVEDAGGA